MTDLDWDHLGIVGLNGVAPAVCGQSLPVCRDTRTEDYFRLPALPANQHAPGPKYSREEIESFAQAGRLTLFPPSGPFPTAFKGVVVLYAKAELLETRSISALDSQPTWSQLTDGTCYTCVSTDTAVSLLEEWGKCLLRAAEAHVVDYFCNEDIEALKESDRLIKLARAAAVSDELRARVTIHSGVTIMYSRPGFMRNVYDFLVPPNFRHWTWEGFQGLVQDAADTLRTRSEVDPSITAKPIPDRFVELGNRLRQEGGPEVLLLMLRKLGSANALARSGGQIEDRRSLAISTVRDVTLLHPTDEVVRESCWRDIRTMNGDTADISFDDETRIKIIACHPLFYLQPELLKFLEDRRIVRIELPEFAAIEKSLLVLAQQMGRAGAEELPDVEVLQKAEGLIFT